MLAWGTTDSSPHPTLASCTGTSPPKRTYLVAVGEDGTARCWGPDSLTDGKYVNHVPQSEMAGLALAVDDKGQVLIGMPKQLFVQVMMPPWYANGRPVSVKTPRPVVSFLWWGPTLLLARDAQGAELLLEYGSDGTWTVTEPPSLS